MKKYEYVSFKKGGMLSEKSEQHREIINKCAELGYRYAGYISINLMPNGRVMDIDLIFNTTQSIVNTILYKFAN